MTTYRLATRTLSLIALHASLAGTAWALPAGPGHDAAASRDAGAASAVTKLANVVFLQTTVLQAACGRMQAFGSFSVQGTVDDGGGNDQGAVVVYDDGVLVASGNFSVPVGATRTFSYDLTVAHTIGVPGVAVSIREFAADPGAVSFINATESPTAACPPLQQVVSVQGAVASVPVPVLSPAALVVLLAALGGLGARALRRRG